MSGDTRPCDDVGCLHYDHPAPGPDTAPDLAARGYIESASNTCSRSGGCIPWGEALAALAPHVTAQVGDERIDALLRWGNEALAERDAALARVDAARRDALTEAADRIDMRLVAKLSGPEIAAWLRTRAAVESPDQPEDPR